MGFMMLGILPPPTCKQLICIDNDTQQELIIWMGDQIEKVDKLNTKVTFLDSVEFDEPILS